MTSTPPKKRSVRFWILILGIPAFLLVSCCGVGAFLALGLVRPSAPIKVDNWKGGLVNRQGTYTMSTGEVFTVKITPNSTVWYEYKDASGRVLITVNEYNASDYHRWHFFLDGSKRLWFYSGDIGTFVWTPQPGGSYLFASAPRNATSSGSMPLEFYNEMGSATQKDFDPPSARP